MENEVETLRKRVGETLLSRGQKGCYVYSQDKRLLAYMSRLLKKEIEV